MHPNPFSPSFSIHPSLFFGRKGYIDKYASALDTLGSANRFFLLTGTRGCGKTSLLHQLAIQAEDRRWDVIEATSADAVEQLAHYVGLDSTSTRTKSFSPSVRVSAVDVSVGSLSSSRTSQKALGLLPHELCVKLRSLKVKRGLALIIDEAQKIKREDIVCIGNAVQQARTAGLEISLVLGGLPNSYAKIRSYRDCTFLHRMMREELWCMKKSETISLLSSMFAMVPEISITEEQINGIGQFAGGHPYLLQLIGDNIYNSVQARYAPSAGMTIALSDELIEDAEQRALVPYKENILDDALAGVHETTRDYISKAFGLRDESGLVKVSELNAQYSASSAQMNSRRAYALNTQVVRKAGRGYLRFGLPHFKYALEPFEYDEPDDADDEWSF